MANDNASTSLIEQEKIENDQTLRYFTAIRLQEPEYVF